MVTSLSKLLGNTSVGSRPKALLVLDDGSVFEGFSCAAKSQGISLQVIEIHTVISDLRIGHGDDLTSIRRVRNDLKIAFK